MTASDQTVAPVRSVDSSNTTDLAVNAKANAPSSSASEVSNVMESSEAGQSVVGADSVASTVGPTEVVLNNTINKGITERTLTIALIAGCCLGVAYLMRGRLARGAKA